MKKRAFTNIDKNFYLPVIFGKINEDIIRRNYLPEENEVERMRIIMTLIWALLIGAALAYVLSSMGGEPFNVTQSIVFSASTFIAIILLDGVLRVSER